MTLDNLLPAPEASNRRIIFRRGPFNPLQLKWRLGRADETRRHNLASGADPGTDRFAGAGLSPVWNRRRRRFEWPMPLRYWRVTVGS